MDGEAKRKARLSSSTAFSRTYPVLGHSKALQWQQRTINELEICQYNPLGLTSQKPVVSVPKTSIAPQGQGDQLSDSQFACAQAQDHQYRFEWVHSLGQPKARATVVRTNLRPLESSSTPSTPNIPYQSSTKPSSVSSGGSPHRRSASAISFTQNGSTLSLPLTQTPYGSPSSDTFTDTDAIRGDGAPRIKSKITRLAKPHDLLSPSPPQPVSRPANGRNRTPSISSGVSLSSTNTSSTTPDYSLYPITTAVPAANPYRYGSVRVPSSTPNHHHYQPFAPRDDSQINYGTTTFNAKVDPTTIPLPPQSPPTSAVSFSSRSSVSRSSRADSADSQHSASTKQNGADLRGGIEALMQFGAAGDDDSDGDSYDEETDLEHQAERKVRAEAKSNRKIEDLEISNRSLLAINVTLEATKHRQAKEIRDLKRKLRESRLILPPQAFKQVMDKDDTEEDEDEGEDGEEVPGDETYLHVKLLLDNLLQAAKQALETKPSDFETRGGAKVLSAEEVENWRDHEADPPGDDETKTGANTSVSPSRANASIDDESETFDSEDEVEALTMPSPSSPPPPVIVTRSP
ncbi:uncharacterized protein EV420DRAFT_1637653 [Desarmillaria tabescens]|uniref:Uncharacterized protein n=1 Tax=Armillaria tabescens TaxID=1929756 RepID=A0AA39NH36_ARMTA|nr:uncharacterized protein EV420DRAFT_1637653 [Desarmillaria tabescens]KAK0465527.1 hypothetical protein EV420DRAFT_1637653 [Desarmillaria tabescens]